MSQRYSDEDRAWLSRTSRVPDSEEPEDERLYNRAFVTQVLAKLAAKDAEKAKRDEINNELRET